MPILNPFNKDFNFKIAFWILVILFTLYTVKTFVYKRKKCGCKGKKADLPKLEDAIQESTE